MNQAIKGTMNVPDPIRQRLHAIWPGKIQPEWTDLPRCHRVMSPRRPIPGKQNGDTTVGQPGGNRLPDGSTGPIDQSKTPGLDHSHQSLSLFPAQARSSRGPGLR
ncbi:hypothetical protein GCM10027256_08260 [Novispirillum itersonii subsp. nipponicum]